MTRILVGAVGLALLAGCAQSNAPESGSVTSTTTAAKSAPIDESSLQTVVIKVPGMT